MFLHWLSAFRAHVLLTVLPMDQQAAWSPYLGFVVHAATLWSGGRLERRLGLELHLVLKADRLVQLQQAAAQRLGAIRGLLQQHRASAAWSRDAGHMRR